jgi:D-alanine-D-alanine ligase
LSRAARSSAGARRGGGVVVLHDHVGAGAPAEELDLLIQVEAVEAALTAAGRTVSRVALTLDLEATRAALESEAPDLVFNLVEGLGGSGRLALLGPLLLDDLGLRFTGSGLTGMAISSSKLLAKRALVAAGLPTPPWLTPAGGRRSAAWPADSATGATGSWILKSVWEHASVGIDDASVVADGRVEAALGERSAVDGRDWFAEAFIEGREINLALLARDGRLEPLPAAEMLFDDFPQGKPRIVGYRAKWDASSFEYGHAHRSFEFTAADAPLLRRLEELARACAEACSLAGYARVDVRIDGDGQPWIIDVNANPCLAPDAGFVANAARAGLSYEELITRIAEAPG